jgi:hypothetical protein
MDYFSGANPDLISNKSLKELNMTLAKPTVIEHPTLTSNLSGFYSDYIQPNIFPIIVFVLISVYLFIKYVLKRDKDENEDKPSKSTKKHKHKHSTTRSNDKLVEEHDLPYEDIMDEYDENQEYDEYVDERERHMNYNDNMMPVNPSGSFQEPSRRSIDDLAKMIFN